MKFPLMATSGAALVAAGAFSAAVPVAHAQVALEPVTVLGRSEATPNQSTVLPDAASTAPSHDAGEYLRGITGVSAGRMGGHGVDPVIRGQKSNQLNIINDGAFTYGGCPNRMDPPASVVNLELIDKVTVTKGYASVTNGPGGTGGTVRFDRDPPTLTSAKPYSVKAGGGYESNGVIRDGWGEAAGGTEVGYVRAGGKYKTAHDYTDGDDRKVRSAFTQFGGTAEMGWTPKNSLVALGYEYNKTEDALFAGAGMDAPLDETNTFRIKARTDNLELGPLSGLRMNAFASLLDHVMDNYSLRAKAAGSMAMMVDSTSNTYGGQLAADLKVAGSEATVGVDVQVNNRDARRYAKATGVDIESVANLQAVAWPDITIAQVGLFGEATVPVSAEGRVKLGLRYDRVDVSYGAADERTNTGGTANRTANALYQSYYGVRGDDRSEDNVGGLVRYEHDLGAIDLFAGASRSVRTADATERGMAMRSTTASQNWVGNPGISAEAHHQLDVGATVTQKDWSVSGSLFYDRVADYILRDAARKQAGVLQNNKATIYRNVDAALSGFELAGKLRVAGDWQIGADVAYTYAENIDDSSPIAQIAPLHGNLSVAYEPKGWSVGSRMRWAAKQLRVDTSTDTGSGQDADQTPGFAVFDLFGSYTAFDVLRIDAGATNISGETYAEHLNRASAFDSTVAQVYEPGRSFYLRGRTDF